MSQPLLLLALEEYYQQPSPEILSKLFDSLNGIITKGCPTLSRDEKLILRASDRRDLFEDRFPLPTTPSDGGGGGERTEDLDHGGGDPDWATSSQQAHVDGYNDGMSTSRSFKGRLARLSDGSVRRMRKTSRSSFKDLIDGQRAAATPWEQQQRGLGLGRPGSTDAPPPPLRTGVTKDTHFFDTAAQYNDLSIPIRIPLTTFREEVSDYSIIQLIQTFAPTSPASFSPPFHPHLHTSGAFTHPIILLFNALLTQKRIIFLGHGQPAGLVANYVLAACSLTGQALRGFAERAFPYSNLAGLEMMEEMPGYIAGVTNPRFEDLHAMWDVLCNLETGKITVSKSIVDERSMTQAYESMTIKSTTGSLGSAENGDISATIPQVSSRPGEPTTKGETADSLFMEEIMAAVESHMGESFIRSRFSEYTNRFIRLAARWEQENIGSTKTHYRSRSYQPGQLGSGITFSDDAAKAKEFNFNSGRIDGWRRTRSYAYWQEVSKTRALARWVTLMFCRGRTLVEIAQNSISVTSYHGYDTAETFQTAR